MTATETFLFGATIGWAACIAFQFLWAAICDFAGHQFRNEFGSHIPTRSDDLEAERWARLSEANPFHAPVHISRERNDHE